MWLMGMVSRKHVWLESMGVVRMYVWLVSVVVRRYIII